MIDTYALTTREQVHAYRIANGERLNTTPETNNLIDNLINTMSARFEKYCDRQFMSRSHTEYYDGKGLTELYPNHYPIISVEAIYDDSDWVWGDDTLISGTNYRSAGNSIIFKSSSYRLSDYRQNIKLVYTAGYATVPYDLETACISEVIRAMDKLEELAVVQKRSNDFQIQYVMTPFLDETKATLNYYRRNMAY